MLEQQKTVKELEGCDFFFDGFETSMAMLDRVREATLYNDRMEVSVGVNVEELPERRSSERSAGMVLRSGQTFLRNWSCPMEMIVSDLVAFPLTDDGRINLADRSRIECEAEDGGGDEKPAAEESVRTAKGVVIKIDESDRNR